MSVGHNGSDSAATITAIQPLPSDPNMRRIRVGKRTVATLRAADVELLKLEVGRTWSAELAQATWRAVAALKARKAAMALLSRRMLSRTELIERLLRKKHDRGVAERIVDELTADRWLDDEAFGKAFARELTRSKPAARRLVAAKLESRKLDQRLADQIARDTVACQDAVAAALGLARRRLRTMKSLSPNAKRRRLAGLLARRGFEEDIIEMVLQRLELATGEDHDP